MFYELCYTSMLNIYRLLLRWTCSFIDQQNILNISSCAKSSSCDISLLGRQTPYSKWNLTIKIKNIPSVYHHLKFQISQSQNCLLSQKIIYWSLQVKNLHISLIKGHHMYSNSILPQRKKFWTTESDLITNDIAIFQYQTSYDICFTLIHMYTEEPKKHEFS